MRKAGLLDKKPLTATRTMLGMARKDTGTEKKAWADWHTYSYMEYETRFYFRAAASAVEGILEVDLFTRKDLAAGKREPRFRIFLDRGREDFISWDMAGEKWSRAKIDMLPTGDGRYSYFYRGRNHATKGTLKLVNGYLKTGYMKDVETAVLSFQTGVRKDEMTRRHRLVTDVIDGYMDTVPDRLPADWMKFISDRAAGHCIFFHREKKTGYCTHCRSGVPVPGDAVHNMAGKCSHCGISATFKGWKKQKRVCSGTTVSILQGCTDGEYLVYRQFRVDITMERSAGYVPEVSTMELYRRIFTMTGEDRIIRMENFEWGEFRNTGIERWCAEGSVHRGRWQNGSGGYGYTRSVPYTGNISRLFRDTGLKYIPVAAIFKSMGNTRVNVMAVLGDMNLGFPYEAFWKMGLRQFVRDRVRTDGTCGKTRLEYPGEHLKPWEYLKLTREGMAQAVRLDATDQQIRIIQRASEARVRLTDEQVLWLDRYMGVSVLMDYMHLQTPHRIIRYLKEKLRVESGRSRENLSLHLWTDYIDMVRQIGWNLRDRSVFFPQDIRRAHDEAAVLFTAWKDQTEAERLKASDAIMHGNAREIKRAFCYRDAAYMITVPGCYLDFKKEGNTQHNCVARYYDSAVKGKCIILFIRRRKAPQKPFCTVEIRNRDGKFAIIQNRAAYNRDAPEDVQEFLEKAVRQAQQIADGMAAGEAERTRMGTAG